VHLFNVVDEIFTEGDFIGWLQKTNERKQTQVSHLLDSFGDLSMDAGWKSGLETIVKFA